MITPQQLLNEVGFKQYSAMVRFKYDRENTSLGAEKLAEMVRAIPGSTRVSTVSLDKAQGIAIFTVKLISSKPPKQAFVAFKENALNRFKGMLLSVEVGAGTIEVKGDFIVKESKNNLKSYIGLLLESGLLLEVSIEELRRQFVECDPPKIAADVFEQIVQTCENKSNYATWMCKKVADGLIPAADFPGWHDLFQFFDRYKQRFQKKDINQVKTAADIEAFKQDYEQAKEAVNQKKAGGAKKEELEPCQLGKLKTSDGKSWKVYKVGKGQYSLERKIGSGAGWCTVSSQNMFDNYLNRGGHYYIFVNVEHPDKEKYQIHYESDQLADISNNTPDKAQRFIVEFYKYLEQVDHKPIPADIKQAERLLQQREEAAKKLDGMKLPEGLDYIDLRGGGKLYPVKDSYTTLTIALMLRDLVGFSREIVIPAAEVLMKSPGSAAVLTVGNTKDIVARSRGTYLGSLSGILPRHATADVNLPQATEENYEAYQDAALKIGAHIGGEVAVRCDKCLPKLETFKFKEDAARKGYRFSKETLRSGQAVRALKELEGQGFRPYGIASGEENDTLVCVSNEVRPIALCNDKFVCSTGYYINSCENSQEIDQYIKCVKFLGTNPERIEPDLRHDEGLGMTCLKRWIELGRWQGILQALRNTKQIEGVDVNKLVVAEISSELWNLAGRLTISLDVGEKAYAIYKPGDISKVLLASEHGMCKQWHPANHPFSSDEVVTQTAFRQFGFDLPTLVTVFQQLHIQMPPALEKIASRARGVNTQNVLKVLQNNLNNFQEREIPLFQYDRGWRQGRQYTVDGNGIYDTWEQLGPAIAESSPQYWTQINQKVAGAQNCRADIFLFFNRGNERRAWNGVVRLINDHNQVIWYARRYGDGQGLQWTIRDIDPDQWTDAGQFEGNYVAPQPEPERQPRQRRPRVQIPVGIPQQGGEQQPAQQGNLGELNVFRQQSQHSDELYVVPNNALVQALRTAGFTNLAADHERLGNDRWNAVIYRACHHRAATTEYVALIYGGAQTMVAGYPQNHAAGEVGVNSMRWRNLTRELDNSIATFGQCRDICRERHIPLPQAIEGWLVYRGEAQ